MSQQLSRRDMCKFVTLPDTAIQNDDKNEFSMMSS